MPTSPAASDISLNMNILVNTGYCAPCSCCFPPFQQKNKLVARKYNGQGSRNVLKHHIVNYVLTFHQSSKKPASKEASREGQLNSGAQVPVPSSATLLESLPSPRIQTSKNPSPELPKYVAVSHTSGKMESFPEYSISFNFYTQFLFLECQFNNKQKQSSQISH